MAEPDRAEMCCLLVWNGSTYFLAGAKRASSIQNIWNVLEFLQHQLDMKKDHASQICARLFCGI